MAACQIRRLVKFNWPPLSIELSYRPLVCVVLINILKVMYDSIGVGISDFSVHTQTPIFEESKKFSDASNSSPLVI